jgi:hypothetical protein
MLIGGLLDSLRRPREPASIFGHQVEKHVAVNQHCSHSFVPGQSHDGVGAHGHVAACLQVRDDAPSASILRAVWRGGYAPSCRQSGIPLPFAAKDLPFRELQLEW